jgi:hypothetical protein
MSNAQFTFNEVTREKAKAAIQIQGLSGRGKTGLALLLAYALTNDWNKVYAIDTENKSMNLYQGLKNPEGIVYEKFKVGFLTPDIGYKPSNYLAFRDVAIANGAEAVIFDSVSHAWQYKGGVLDLVAQAKSKSARYQKDQYAAWGVEEVVKEKNELLELIRSDKVHMITTVRVKEKMEYDKDEAGKTVLVSLGEQQIQQADLKYEPDLVLEMVSPGSDTAYPCAKVLKTRYAILKLGETYCFNESLLSQIKEYLDEGVDPEILIEKQRKEYVTAIKNILDTKPNLKAIWDIMKKDAGYENTKLADLPLDVVKKCYIKLTE